MRLTESIHEENGSFVLRSKDGKKKLGTFKTRKEAEDREKQILRFTESSIKLTEASKDGSTWDAVLIAPGLNKNKTVNYSEALLEKSVSMFDGVKAYAYEFDGRNKWPLDHISQEVREALPGGAAKNLVGYYDNPEYKPGIGIVGKFHATANWLKESMKNAWDKGNKTLFSFSIDAWPKAEKALQTASGVVRDILEFAQIDEVTVVSEGAAGAGGMLLNLSETLLKLNESYDKQTEDDEMKITLKFLKETYPKLVEGLKETDTDDVLKDGIEKAMKAIPETEKAKLIADGYELPDQKKSEGLTEAQVKKTMESVVKDLIAPLEKKMEDSKKLDVSNASLAKKLQESKLPEVEKEFITAQSKTTVMNETEQNTMLKRVEDKYASLQESKLYVPNQDIDSVRLNVDEFDKKVAAFEGMLLDEDVEIGGAKIPRFLGVHESFRKLTNVNEGPYGMGLKIMEAMALGTVPLNKEPAEYFTRIREAGSRLTEVSLITDWATIFGDSVRRAMLKMYDRTDLDGWRKIFTVGSAPDFRNNLKQRLGGFGNLATVSSGQTYPSIANITDEEVSYAVQKRGGLFTIQMEDMVNDDLGVVRNIPRKLSQAAAQTLHQFAFDFINDNVVLDYDSVALFNSAHNNLGSTALSDAALDDRLFAFNEQTEQDSGTALGIKPKYIMVPAELERIALEITVSQVTSTSGRAETMPNIFFTRHNIETIPVYYWTDANNWYLSADKNRIEGAKLDFLNGREEPELFLQDQPTVGSVFNADELTWKIRHIYGGDITDHRQFDGSIVS